MYDFQRKHGHDIDCHVLAPASTCSNKRASTCSTTRASTCITTCASMVLNGASTCSNTCASTCITTRASTCITTRASTCHYTRARLLFKNMHPGPGNFAPFWMVPVPEKIGHGKKYRYRYRKNLVPEKFSPGKKYRYRYRKNLVPVPKNSRELPVIVYFNIFMYL